MRSRTYDAIVLRAVDVGEADRFCVLLTREAGRLAARARGVRKPTSRMGGSLLAFRRLAVEVSGNEQHLSIASVGSAAEPPSADYAAVARMSRGVELLLALTHDAEPMPEVFDATARFLGACHREGPDPYPAYAIRVLALLGILPAEDDDPRFARLSDPTRAYILVAAGIEQATGPLTPDAREVDTFLRSVLADHLEKPLKSG